ncbi:MAG: 30S ribosomal protein S16 [Patescibacteria group bacterium]|nr:30S ribosomal protein S16 [Patescibacteria group bacterium]
MLVIRFSRVGKRNHAQYKVVVAEKSAPIKGRFVEQVGSYDPHLKTSSLKEERIKYWISNGAICSDSVHNLLVRESVIKGEKRNVKIRAKKKAEGEEEKKEEEKYDKAEVKDDAEKEGAKKEPQAEKEKELPKEEKTDSKEEKKEEKSKKEEKKEESESKKEEEKKE